MSFTEPTERICQVVTYKIRSLINSNLAIYR